MLIDAVYHHTDVTPRSWY